MPIKPVSLQRTVSEKQREMRSFDDKTEADVPDFPWGLEISLGVNELRKLGFGKEGLVAGKRVRLAGTAMVSEVSAETVNSLDEKSARLRIETLGLEVVDEDATPAQAIFGEGA